MTTRGPIPPKTKLPATSKDPKWGVEELAVAVRSMQAEIKAVQAELKKMSASIEKLWHGADLEYYAAVAKQLSGVPATLEKVERLLATVLNDRAAGHQAIEELKGEVAAIKAWQTLHERTGHPPSGSGSIRP